MAVLTETEHKQSASAPQRHRRLRAGPPTSYHGLARSAKVFAPSKHWSSQPRHHPKHRRFVTVPMAGRFPHRSAFLLARRALGFNCLSSMSCCGKKRESSRAVPAAEAEYRNLRGKEPNDREREIPAFRKVFRVAAALASVRNVQEAPGLRRAADTDGLALP